LERGQVQLARRRTGAGFGRHWRLGRFWPADQAQLPQPDIGIWTFELHRHQTTTLHRAVHPADETTVEQGCFETSAPSTVDRVVERHLSDRILVIAYQVHVQTDQQRVHLVGRPANEQSFRSTVVIGATLPERVGRAVDQTAGQRRFAGQLELHALAEMTSSAHSTAFGGVVVSVVVVVVVVVRPAQNPADRRQHFRTDHHSAVPWRQRHLPSFDAQPGQLDGVRSTRLLHRTVGQQVADGRQQIMQRLDHLGAHPAGVHDLPERVLQQRRYRVRLLVALKHGVDYVPDHGSGPGRAGSNRQQPVECPQRALVKACPATGHEHALFEAVDVVSA
ncbi:hypothetical protein T4C_3022, partial [Trichinella pseudospiralis]